jgi:hypothetical protein
MMVFLCDGGNWILFTINLLRSPKLKEFLTAHFVHRPGTADERELPRDEKAMGRPARFIKRIAVLAGSAGADRA